MYQEFVAYYHWVVWTFGFPVSGNCKYSYYEHSCIDLWKNTKRLSFLLGKYVRIKCLDHTFTFTRNWQSCFPKWWCHFTFPRVSQGSSISFTSLLTLGVVNVFNLVILASVQWYFMVVLICIFLMTDDVEHFFLYLLFLYLLWRSVCSNP